MCPYYEETRNKTIIVVMGFTLYLLIKSEKKYYIVLYVSWSECGQNINSIQLNIMCVYYDSIFGTLGG